MTVPSAERLRALLAWIDDHAFGESGAIEFEGRLLFPDTIRRVGAGGVVTEDPVMMRVLRLDERAKARKIGRDLLAKAGAKLEDSPDLAEAYETLAILSLAIRAREAPHEQKHMAEDLARAYEVSALLAAFDRLIVYEKIADPRPSELDDRVFWALVDAVRRSGSARPLTGTDGSAQIACITRMASLLWSYRTRSSSEPSPETSTPES